MFFILSLIFWIIYYKNTSSENNIIALITWLLTILTFFYSQIPPRFSFKNYLAMIKKRDILIVLFIIFLYWVSHLWNFSQAPWNQNGLFDDAAWDIYFAKNHVFSKVVFQPAYFDTVGYISREVVFHYYISIFFKAFGYNLLVFNISLLFLGFITVFFTTITIDRIFKNSSVTLLSAVIINFFPIHFTHIFMGHRYAISAPLMVASLYFLYTAFYRNSNIRAFASSFIAALCWDSAIMGKQYILGLLIAGIAILFFRKRSRITGNNVKTASVWIIGLVISALPLILYILFNYSDYSGREKGLLKNFISLYKTDGISALKVYLDNLIELFFAKHTYIRQFLPDYYLIPTSYYLLILPGLIVALIKKRFEVIILGILPVGVTLISGAYDFRVLIAVPIWVLTMAFFLNYLFGKENRFRKEIGRLMKIFGLIIVILGLYPSIVYINKISKDPNHFYLLPHKDVAVSRFVQDIVVGSNNPSDKMKFNELNRHVNLNNVGYDTLFCPYGAYAIAHLYLQNYGDKEILSFCDQGIQLLKSPREILKDNIIAVNSYQVGAKNLKLIWEVSDKTKGIIPIFSKYKKFGSEETISSVSDGRAYSLYILTINKINILKFKNELDKELAGGGVNNI